MKEIKTHKRYRCDFCKKTGIKRKMEWHEKMCFRNPNRFCSECNNTGLVDVYGDHWLGQTECTYCAKMDKELLKEIDAREANLSTVAQ